MDSAKLLEERLPFDENIYGNMVTYDKFIEMKQNTLNIHTTIITTITVLLLTQTRALHT